MRRTVEASIIIPCKNEGNNLKNTIDSIKASKNTGTYEIIVVDDNSEDNCTDFLENDIEGYGEITLIRTINAGCSNAKNAGAKIASGNYYFFLDAHVRVEDYWMDKLINTMENGLIAAVTPCIADMYNSSAAGYGETWTEMLKLNWIAKNPDKIAEIPIACGCAFGIRKEVFNKIKGFDHFFKNWGREDEEISLKIWLYGYKIAINPFVKIRHLFRKKFPYEVTATNIIYNTICMAYSHFNKFRLEKTVAMTKFDFNFNEAEGLIRKDFNKLMLQRQNYFNERKYEDDYFFHKFKIPY